VRQRAASLSVSKGLFPLRLRVALHGVAWRERDADSVSIYGRPPASWPTAITVRHGSADTVVRAMNDFSGKCYFSGSDSSETFWRIFKKFCTVDYVGDPTPHANVGVNRFKGACLRMREVVAVRRLFFFLFLGPMRIATGRPVGPINVINGLNDASCWHSYSLYGLDNKN